MRPITPPLLLLLLAAVWLPAESADALCTCMLRRPPPVQAGTQSGSIASDPAYSPSAAVFILRDGVKTVLTVETAYEGPKEPISMVLPVPTTIGRDQVRTVPGSLFRNLDRRTAPRVDHFFPACRRARPRRMAAALGDGSGGGGGGFAEAAAPQPPPVEVIDEWELDEYDITVLSASQSNGLLDFLRERGLDLGTEAEPALRAYIETDHRFVFATVDPSRAHTIGEDTMVLSPLQLEYESENLTVPVRLGTVNSPGEQELLLYVLSKDGRHEVANRTSVAAPTDLRLQRSASGAVAELYSSIIDEQFRRMPGAVVTEFAHTLGSRVGYNNVRGFGLSNEQRRAGRWTLTRMRHRFGKELDDDLVLRPAEEPLRMTRRYRFPNSRVWTPRGQSGFHVRFVVEHNSCADQRRQRAVARRFAIAENMWGQQERPWPGELLRDDIESLGIEAGSTAPDGWPPPPPAPTPPAPPEPEVAPPTPAPAAGVAQPAPQAIPVEVPRAAPVEAEGGLCTVQWNDQPLPLLVPIVGLLVVLRRRNR